MIDFQYVHSPLPYFLFSEEKIGFRQKMPILGQISQNHHFETCTISKKTKNSENDSVCRTLKLPFWCFLGCHCLSIFILRNLVQKIGNWVKNEISVFFFAWPENHQKLGKLQRKGEKFYKTRNFGPFWAF